MNSGSHYIAGQWVPSTGEIFTSIDPATGDITWQGHAATRTEVDQAVDAARAAFEQWVDTPFDRRVELVTAFGKQLTENKDALALTISRDMGKPYWESLTEVGAMVGKVDLSIKAYTERCPTVTRDLKGAAGTTRYKPHGVCAVFGPFNLPAHLPNGHIIPALLAGNAIVFKPSEQTPAVGYHMIDLWHTAGLPTGLINMVQGPGSTGKLLSEHPNIDGLFFTGSAAVGRMLATTTAHTPGKILALEMGGNNPLVVWDAADTDAAAYLAIQSAYITSGQRCSCARRLIIPDDAHGQTLLDHITAMIKRIRVGSHTDRPEPFMGPVISSHAAQKLLDAQQNLINRGGKSIVQMANVNDCAALLSPGLIDVTDITDRADEEFFGPLLQVIRVPDFDAALQEANNTAFGLAAALISDDPKLYDRFYRRVRAGVINWNRQSTGASGAMPFGGVGDSGNHRPSGYHAIDYCAYPVASIETDHLALPDKPTPGINL